MELSEAGVKKRVRRRGFRQSSLHKQARHQRRNFQLARQVPRRFCVYR
jgi:hypothetical protein